MKDLKSIEEKILDRALYLFGKNGSTKVPVRSIVKEAGVNIGAINYYFGTKENMLLNVKEFYIDNIEKAYSPLYDEELDDEEKIIECANEIIEYSLRYPGVLVMNKEALYAEKKDEIDIKIIESMKEVNEKLDNILKKVLGFEDEDFKFNKTIFISSIVYPFMDETEEVFDNEIKYCKDKRIEYIKYIINSIKKK
ncbi:TetR/AcrR family transcriptional regulator [Clostridium sp.]|uniref:TetR/AcrR family transcriptional regulator n=1 Tax=Clostridium sp. TaxID=1506 RepID=UPI00260E0951|nr:TetR/AcrR family transcriptional regulator [Clostridium sp.]